jgi:serine/threonine protein kinase
MPLGIGETFAGYRILRLLGSGGMGEVYVVQHPRLPRHDALKVLRPDVSSDTSFRERFVREADLAAGLRHPHIVGIHDRGEYSGQLWIAMDYIEGTDAAQLVQQRYPAGMPAELAIPIITAVASALDYAHKKSLLHRDVKPANIIVADLDSDDRRVFLADFGIARPLDDTSGITTTNMTVGTVAYAAPEQLMGEQLDGRADQYALAATAYHLLTGLQLFPHSNPAVVISRHLNTTPPTLGDRRPDCACFDEVLQTALAKNPDDRFPSCSDFARAMVDESPGRGAASGNATTQAAPQPRRSAPTSAASPTAKSATGSRRTWVLVGGIAATIILIGAAAMVWRPWQHNTPHAEITAIPQPATSSATGAPPPPAPTRAAETDIQTTTAVVNGQPANGFHEVSNPNADVPLDCEKTSQAAVTANVYYCYPNSASADICWSSPPTSMLCLDNPWDKELRRFPLSTLYLPPVRHGVDPWPYALELDDGARCRLLIGMRDMRPNGDTPEYDCGEGQSGVVVLMSRDSTNPINRASPMWTVSAGPLGAVAQIHTVTRVWFAGAE